MAIRNLTERSPIVPEDEGSSSSDSQLQNPFSNRYNTAGEDGSSVDSASNLVPNSRINRRFVDPETPRDPSQRSLQSLLNSSEAIQSPSEFDRYPKLSSRINSVSNSMSSRLHTPSKSISSSVADSAGPSGKETDSSGLADDFSPFGGYPASSFPLHIDEKEDDDYIHNPDPIEEAYLDKHHFINDLKSMDRRSFGGVITIIILLLGAIALFVAWPVITHEAYDRHGHTSKSKPRPKTFNPIHYNPDNLTNYVYPQLSAIRTSLIDPDTPKDAYKTTAKDGSSWELVFSDEFNAEGRTFYDGDDQFWTAPDLWYGVTKDLEWYDPDASTTSNGALVLQMDAIKNHDLFYRSGMVQSWNKFCFTQGKIEVGAQLPSYGNITGLWPGIWTLGNLGRPGFAATTEGVWPYSYEACDAGITANQSSTDGISNLLGQKLNVCTCDGEDHPNQGVGRGAPEIDCLEGEVDTVLKVGLASQSIQIAPFDVWYMPDYDFIEIYNNSITSMNTYAGGPFQQAISAVSTLNTSWYQFGDNAGHYQKYGFEYLNDNDNGYCQWFVGEPTYTVYSQALHPNGNIGWRRISKEPMSIILNLGVSNNWAYIDWGALTFPVQLKFDYVRIYQPAGNVSVTCDPDDYPTYDYIQAHPKAYKNWNVTSWEDAGYDFPKNVLTGGCKSSKYDGGS